MTCALTGSRRRASPAEESITRTAECARTRVGVLRKSRKHARWSFPGQNSAVSRTCENGKVRHVHKTARKTSADFFLNALPRMLNWHVMCGFQCLTNDVSHFTCATEHKGALTFRFGPIHYEAKAPVSLLCLGTVQFVSVVWSLACRRILTLHWTLVQVKYRGYCTVPDSGHCTVPAGQDARCYV